MRKLVLVLLLAVLMPPFHIAPSVVRAQAESVRRVNTPYFADEVIWAQTAIFWFGQDEQGVPGKNYADVRLAYTAEALCVRVTVVDYYLWYKPNPAPTDELTQYDAVAIYLDTGFDGAATPQTDDYTFLIGARHWPNENAVQYHRQARGTGAGWDTSWAGDWTDYEAMQWSNNGPNDNGGNIDYGWMAIFTIPWGTLGRSGPPPEGVLWGLGVRLYDRDDQPPAGYVAPGHWPGTLDPNSPDTWGELHFGYADYQPPSVTPEGTTTIRATLREDNTVEDAWMGGGGTCSGGHEGGSETNHGSDTGLFVGTETSPTHFPCFNKSYLRFSLDAILPGKTVISASLTLHLWGHAGETPDLAQPSWVHLFTISDPWEEMTIHWNNAPLAQENVAAIWVNPYSGDRANPDWPGDPYVWDATQAVAEAYADGHPVSLAIYGSDTAQHSSKYLTSSETDDWNAEGRPTLTVVWGQEPQLVKSVKAIPAPSESVIKLGDTITYTLQVLGSGQALTVTDVLAAGISHPLTYTSSDGSVGYEPAARKLTWKGALPVAQAVTITYPVTVTQSGTYAIINTAHLTPANGSTATASSMVIVEARQVFLPCVFKWR
jgi:hypothetical protein